jgi:hypothetical protein
MLTPVTALHKSNVNNTFKIGAQTELRYQKFDSFQATLTHQNEPKEKLHCIIH